MDYVHGYNEKEFNRLEDQANCLEELLHHDSVFANGSRILEVGCGTGSQTKIIAAKNPASKFVSIDISESSIQKAKSLIDSLGITNVQFQVEDIFALPFEDESFDHIVVCFVLEHLPDPIEILTLLGKKLKKGGSIVVVEGDHGSAYFYPHSTFALAAIDCQVKLQVEAGGNAMIGRQIYPLLERSGYVNCQVTPRMVYVDSSRPRLVEGFIKNTFTAMIEGVRENAIRHRLIDEQTFDRGIRDLYRTAGDGGVFCYCFFKGVGYRPGDNGTNAI
jgi:phospholipid N-methyltransferase